MILTKLRFHCKSHFRQNLHLDVQALWQFRIPVLYRQVLDCSDRADCTTAKAAENAWHKFRARALSQYCQHWQRFGYKHDQWGKITNPLSWKVPMIRTIKHREHKHLSAHLWQSLSMLSNLLRIHFSIHTLSIERDFYSWSGFLNYVSDDIVHAFLMIRMSNWF